MFKIFKRQVLFILLGLTLGTGCDFFHSQGGVLYYPNPFFFKTALFVPFVFTGAFLIMGNFLVLMNRLIYSTPRVPSLGKLVLTGVFYISLYAFSGFVHPESFYKTAALYFFAFGIWYILHKSLRSLLLGIFIASGGCFFEAFISSYGWFYYVQPDFFGIPFWLPALYIAGAQVFLGMIQYQSKGSKRSVITSRNSGSIAYQSTISTRIGSVDS